MPEVEKVPDRLSFAVTSPNPSMCPVFLPLPRLPWDEIYTKWRKETKGQRGWRKVEERDGVPVQRRDGMEQRRDRGWSVGDLFRKKTVECR
jgi:hypothetical protein